MYYCKTELTNIRNFWYSFTQLILSVLFYYPRKICNLIKKGNIWPLSFYIITSNSLFGEPWENWSSKFWNMFDWDGCQNSFQNISPSEPNYDLQFQIDLVHDLTLRKDKNSFRGIKLWIESHRRWSESNLSRILFINQNHACFKICFTLWLFMLWTIRPIKMLQEFFVSEKKNHFLWLPIFDEHR